ncbi:MAG: hypothetical protein SWZ49_08750 [Cyanobacteriota bacterium]|nr:hypothetical protein [Cyanobacteriota bacterium]
MKILYCILPLLISVASPSFVQNSIFPVNTNQFNNHEQAQSKSRRRRKPHRGSGRRHLGKINKLHYY